MSSSHCFSFNWFCMVVVSFVVMIMMMWFQSSISTSSTSTSTSISMNENNNNDTFKMQESNSFFLLSLLKDLLVNNDGAHDIGFGLDFGFKSIIELLLLSLLFFILVLPLLLLSASTFLLVTRSNNNNNNNSNRCHLLRTQNNNNNSVDLSEVLWSVYPSNKLNNKKKYSHRTSISSASSCSSPSSSTTKYMTTTSASSTSTSSNAITTLLTTTTSRSQLIHMRHFLEIAEQQYKEDQRLYQQLIYSAFKLWEWVKNRHRSNHFGLSAKTGDSGSRMWVHHSNCLTTKHRKRRWDLNVYENVKKRWDTVFVSI